MKNYKSANNILILLFIFSIGFGCKFFPFDRAAEAPTDKQTEAQAATKTVITKEILKERLGKKGIEIEKEINTDEKQRILKPNPSILLLRFSNSKTTFKLNNEEFGSFGELVNKLKEIFRQREANGIFIEGTNEINKRLTLPAYDDDIADYNTKEIYVEDFEKLVDDLRKEDITQLKLDINEQNNIQLSADSRTKVPIDIVDTAVPVRRPTPTVVSGGIVNGKATNLVKPVYPPAAKAVRASGAVNVQVTINENGDVISASAVSGHPLLKPAAMQAARESKFAPTILAGNPVRVTGVVVYNFTPEQ